MLRTGITVDCASSGVILRLALQRPLCNLCREVYNETKAEYSLSVFAVALLAEGVDRNQCHGAHDQGEQQVALLAEGVDRNQPRGMVVNTPFVALLAEGVDRNDALLHLSTGMPTSPSSRRAWIEIVLMCTNGGDVVVALLAEGVDRNISPSATKGKDGRSPSSRRAWIEICPCCYRRVVHRSPSSRRAWIEI